MAKKEEIKLWHPYGRLLLIKAVRKGTNGILIAQSVAESARNMYNFFIEEKGALVPEDLLIGDQLYVSLPGLQSIEGVTDESAEETYFLLDYNYIKARRPAEENLKPEEHGK